MSDALDYERNRVLTKAIKKRLLNLMEETFEFCIFAHCFLIL